MLLLFWRWESAAPVLVVVPDVAGLSQSAASAAVSAASLSSSVALQASLYVPAGIVISQSPVAGSIVSAGTSVVITVSIGVAPYTAASVTVRAFKRGFFGGYIREIGSTFSITTPYEYTPYWMTLVGTPPPDWLPLLEGYSEAVVRSIINIPTPEEATHWTASGEHP